MGIIGFSYPWIMYPISRRVKVEHEYHDSIEHEYHDSMSPSISQGLSLQPYDLLTWTTREKR